MCDAACQTDVSWGALQAEMQRMQQQLDMLRRNIAGPSPQRMTSRPRRISSVEVDGHDVLSLPSSPTSRATPTIAEEREPTTPPQRRPARRTAKSLSQTPTHSPARAQHSRQRRSDAMIDLFDSLVNNSAQAEDSPGNESNHHQTVAQSPSDALFDDFEPLRASQRDSGSGRKRGESDLHDAFKAADTLLIHTWDRMASASCPCASPEVVLTRWRLSEEGQHLEQALHAFVGEMVQTHKDFAERGLSTFPRRLASAIQDFVSDSASEALASDWCHYRFPDDLEDRLALLEQKHFRAKQQQHQRQQQQEPQADAEMTGNSLEMASLSRVTSAPSFDATMYSPDRPKSNPSPRRHSHHRTLITTSSDGRSIGQRTPTRSPPLPCTAFAGAEADFTMYDANGAGTAHSPQFTAHASADSFSQHAQSVVSTSSSMSGHASVSGAVTEGGGVVNRERRARSVMLWSSKNKGKRNSVSGLPSRGGMGPLGTPDRSDSAELSRDVQLLRLAKRVGAGSKPPEAVVRCVRSHIESRALSRLYAIAFPQDEEMKKKNRELSDRFRALQFLTPTDFGLPPACQNETLLSVAASELRQINHVHCAAEKLRCISRSCSVIFRALNLNRKEGQRPGADDFLPVYVYVVLRAAVPSLWSNIEFIQTYRDPSELLGQEGYLFVNLQSAVLHLQHLSPDDVNLSDEEFRRRQAEFKPENSDGL